MQRDNRRGMRTVSQSLVHRAFQIYNSDEKPSFAKVAERLGISKSTAWWILYGAGVVDRWREGWWRTPEYVPMEILPPSDDDTDETDETDDTDNPVKALTR